MRSFVLGLVIVGGVLCTCSRMQAEPQDFAFPFAPEIRGMSSYLGIGLADIDADRAKSLNLDGERGVEVVRVQEGSPADKAGLKVGDVVLSYNGENILGAQQLGRLVSETPLGRHVKVQYWRDGKSQTATVVTAGAALRDPNFETEFRQLNDRVHSFKFQMPADIPSPLLIWTNRLLGLASEPLDPQLAAYFGVKSGVLVRSVEKGSVADKAGFRSGDVLTAVGGQPLKDSKGLTECIRNQAGNTPIQVSLVRNRKSLTLSVARAGMPE